MIMPDLELRERWEARIAEFRASGLSGARWCKEKGLNARQLYYWLARVKDPSTKPECQPKWLEVKIEETVNTLEVKIGKAVIEVRPGFDPELLSRVVRTLALC